MCNFLIAVRCMRRDINQVESPLLGGLCWLAGPDHRDLPPRCAGIIVRLVLLTQRDIARLRYIGLAYWATRVRL